MAYDGAGNYSLPAGSDVATGDTILASDLNIPLDDVEAALSQVLLRSGVAPMTGDLDLGGFDVINAGGSGGTFLTEDDIGTSGHKIPYLDIANTWSAVQTFEAGCVLGNEVADVVTIKGTVVNAYSSAMLAAGSAEGLRNYLGWGTTVNYNVGTSGATVPALNGANTWSRNNNFGPSADSYSLMISANSASRIPAQISNSEPTPLAPIYFVQFASSAGECGSIKGVGALTGTTYNTSSDRRLKQNIRPLDNSGAIIDAIQPRYWEWRQGGQTDFGLVAQEVAEISEIAHTIVRGDDGPLGGGGFKPWQMEKAALVPILLAEIKALRERVAALEAALP